MCHIRLQAPTLARKCNISHWFPYGTDRRASGRAGGRVDVRSRDYQIFLDGLVTNRSRVLSALQSRRKTNQMNSKNFPGELSSEIHWFFDSFGQQKLKLKTKLWINFFFLRAEVKKGRLFCVSFVQALRLSRSEIIYMWGPILLPPPRHPLRC